MKKKAIFLSGWKTGTAKKWKSIARVFLEFCPSETVM